MLHGDLLGERARLTPEAPALVFVPSGARSTYRTLDARAAATAVAWASLGLRPADRVGLLAANSPEFLDVFFSAAKSGIIVVPLSTRYTAHELAFVVRDAGLRGLVYGAGFGDTIRTLRADVEVAHWIAIDEKADARDGDLASLRAPGAPPGWRPFRGHPEDTCCLLYTSGTTGKPKGVIIPHRMVSWNGYNTAVCWDLRPTDVSPVFTPLYHAGGLAAFLVPIVAAGGTVVLHQRFDAAEIWDTIGAERCTVVLGVPTIFKLLAEAPEFVTADVSSLRWCISGGAPLPTHLIDVYRARGVTLKQGYGLTEVGVNCFAMSEADAFVKAGSIGRPLMFTEATLVDEGGREVAVGEVGELRLRGPHVSRGYWNNPTATAAALDAEGWFHTGDLARRDADGFYTIAGRRTDMIISGGVNVYPAEIEGELLQHPDVEDAAVVGIPHEIWGEVGVAFVVARGSGATTETLRAFLQERMAKYKLPAAFVFVDALPRTPYGKVVKGDLRDAYLADRRSPTAGSIPVRDSRPSTDLLTHRVDGSGPPLLLLNGGMMSVAAWESVTAALAGHYQVIRCDFRGQLLSPGTPPPSMAGHVADVVRLLDHLSQPRVHVVGTSFGAEAGLLLAASHPDRVASLVLATVTDRITPRMEQEAIPIREAARAAAAGGDKLELFARLEPQIYSDAYRRANEAALAERRALASLLPAGWFTACDGLFDALEGLDLRPALAQVACPTLVIVASEDRALYPEHGRAVAAGIRGAILEVFETCGHALVLEQTPRFLASVERFLAAQMGGAEDV